MTETIPILPGVDLVLSEAAAIALDKHRDPEVIASALLRALGQRLAPPAPVALFEESRDTPPGQCPCGCGRELVGRQKRATAACRKRLERRRAKLPASSPLTS